MVKAVLIDKACESKNVNLKVDKDELYKKCKFKSNDSFSLRHTWKVDKTWSKKNNVDFKYVSVYAKNNGRANMENKYDLPPPIDKELFFGSLIILAHETKNLMSEEDYRNSSEEQTNYLEYVDPIDLTLCLWNSFYENLFGGFEDLSSTALLDELEEDELDNIPDNMKTSSGYLKDDFVVDDDDLIMEDDEIQDTDESEFSTSGEQDEPELQFEEYEYSDEDKLLA